VRGVYDLRDGKTGVYVTMPDDERAPLDDAQALELARKHLDKGLSWAPQPEASRALIDAAQVVVGYSDCRDDGMQGAGQMLHDAIDKLRAVLAAQPQPEAQPEPEPVAQVDDKAWQATMMPHPQPQPEVPVPAPPFDPAVEPPWHRSDMGPAQPEAKDDVAYCQWCDRPVSEHAVIGKCEFVKGRKLPQPDPCELTDKEIWKLWLTTEAGPYDFARAVLAAAREKP